MLAEITSNTTCVRVSGPQTPSALLLGVGNRALTTPNARTRHPRAAMRRILVHRA
eukprot:CAMPEP_0206036366 /NCGR_PEP_ID=MMETSP1466-20131121/2714_1 /ASSEMBLY_ACC=CAM_ASM_001126 /TAXON_ID=44452 /ORGANISM="Pavlova gyrans, Strain CCMP608" /LENGTH=54 /DNA_ID=CAMNT_0053410827 /DNA_START=1 /DNA_END=165 /DNA_ORIENTATION=-